MPAAAGPGRADDPQTGAEGGTALHRLGDDPELLVAVHATAERLVRMARRVHGGTLLAVTDPGWPGAPWIVRAAGLVVLGEHWVLRSPDQLAADQLKAASVAISTGTCWSTAGPSHATLQARRAVPGPMVREVDRDAAARRAATGSNAEGVA